MHEMLMRVGTDFARAREVLQDPWALYHRVPGNLASKLFEKIEQAATENPEVSPFEAYARRHRRLLVGAVAKCTRLVLPDGPAGIIVDYYCPYGGH